MRRLETLGMAVLFILACAVPAPALAEPLVPDCVQESAGGGWEGGGSTLCESPGNAQIVARPSVLAQGAMGGFLGGGFGGI